MGREQVLEAETQRDQESPGVEETAAPEPDVLANAVLYAFTNKILHSPLAQLVERVTSNDEVSRSNRLMGN